MNLGKKILIFLILVSIYSLLSGLFRFFGVTTMTASSATTFHILLSMSIIIALGALFKHKYWIAACAFSGLSRIANTTAAFLFKSHLDVDVSIRSAMIVGMVCTIVSLYYFYKLYRVEDFTFEKYLRFKD